MRRRVLFLAFAALTVPIAVARAQGNGGANANANANANASATATGTGTSTSAPTATDTGANPSMTAAPSGRAATGYGYSDHPPPAARGGRLQVRSGRPAAHHPTVPAQSGPVATLPGFEMLAEGGSRLFVELSQAVPVEERRAHGTLTYVLHGAHVAVHNNTNPLVTVHFNTPVASARLVPSGHDLLFVVALRANATPTWKVNPGKEGSSVLTVDFPKGSFLTGAPTTPQQ